MASSAVDCRHEPARLAQVYAQWEQQTAASERYALWQRPHLFAIQQRQRAVLELLRQAGMVPLSGRRILELGCGTGGVLLELLAAGADPAGLHGIDLLNTRVRTARERLPHLPLACGSGQRLPYPDRRFDLVLQFTVFSSILDEAIGYTVAREMLRVLKPGGLIVWYDFWLNPVNRQTKGIRPKAIRRLFPNCRYTWQRITLAPPLARRVAPVTWLGASLLEKLQLFNTHYLAAIRPL